MKEFSTLTIEVPNIGTKSRLAPHLKTTLTHKFFAIDDTLTAEAETVTFWPILSIRSITLDLRLSKSKPPCSELYSPNDGAKFFVLSSVNGWVSHFRNSSQVADKAGAIPKNY